MGGAEIALSSLLAAIDRSKWQPVVLLGQGGPLAKTLRRAKVPVDILRLPKALGNVRQGRIGKATALSPRRIASTTSYVLRLAVRLRRRRVELIHANSLKACVLAGLAGRLAGIPVVWHIHSVLGSPAMSSTGRRLMLKLSRWLPAHIICNSRVTAEDFSAVMDRVSVIPVGTDSGRFFANGIPRNGHPLVGMVARFAPIKGQHIFIQAAQGLATTHPQAEFVLAGSALFGEEHYERQVREMAGSGTSLAVRFLDFVDDVPQLMRKLDVVVSPSTQAEGFGQVIVEAMLAGKPVIASAAGGPIELIEDGVTGRLVPPGDVLALTRAISELLDDPGEAAAIGRRARERALQRYDIRNTTRQIEAVYEKVLSKK
jgi:glycosyltransferase involved in cell wall biosynthesis